MILITGATGWLGQRLILSVQDQYPTLPIRVLIRPGEPIPSSWAGRIEWVAGDLTNPDSLSAFFGQAEGGILFHCAGVIHPRRVADFYRVNQHGTRTLLTLASQAKVKRAVVVSSNSPCGCNPHPHHRFDESSPYHPYMHYGRSKMLMEQVVHEIAQTHALETVIIRAPWFYGPGQPDRQVTFFRMIQEGRVPLLGKGDNQRSMAYVDELANGLVLAAYSPKAAGQTYWIADEQPYRMTTIIDTIEQVLSTSFGRQVAHRRIHLPAWIGDVAMGCDALIQWVGWYHQKIHVLSEMNKTIACCTQKARQELGFQPSVTLEEGMRRSIQWAIDHQQF